MQFQISKPITVIYLKNTYLTRIDSIALSLRKHGAKIIKKSPNQGMIFVNPRTKKFKDKNIMDLVDGVWKIENWT